MSPASPFAGGSMRLPLAVATALSVGIGIAWIFVGRQTAQRHRAQVESELVSISELKVGQVSAWRRDIEHDAILLAAVVVGEAGSGDDQALLAAISRLGRLPTFADKFADALALAGDGKVLGPASARPPSAAQAALAGPALSSGLPTVGELEATSDLTAELAVAVPLEGARPRALLLRVDPAEELFPILASWPVPSTSAESMLISRDGDSVRLLSPRRHAPGGPLSLRWPAASPDLVETLAAQNAEGAVSGRDYRSIPVVAAVHRIPGTSWSLVAKVDEEEALAKPRQAQRHLSLVFLLLNASALAVMVLLARRQIQDREREQQLHAAERKLLLQQFSLLSRNANDIVLLATRDGQVLDQNDRALEAYGHTREQMAAMTLGELCAPGEETRLAARLEDLSPQGARFELMQRRADATEFPAEVSLRPFTASGHDYVRAIARDITERRAALEAVRLSEEKFRDAFQEASFGILLADEQGRIVEANRSLQLMLGLSESELVGHPLDDFRHPEQAGRSRELRAVVEGLSQRAVDERKLRKKDGSVLHAVIRVNAVGESDEGRRLVIAFVEDVTERKLLQQRLLFADRMASMGTLAAGVGHEINNPLAFVAANLGFAVEELESDSGDLGEVTAALKEAQQGAQRVREIGRDLRTFAREDQSGAASCELAKVLQTAMKLAQNEIRHRARLVSDFGPLPFARGSEHRLGQVFLNLLVNAAHAIPEGHAEQNQILVSARVLPEKMVAVEVRDTGHGIPANLRERIFEPFFTTKPVGEGTGLGLSICHGIVVDLGGTIEVESEVGRGSTFRVTLPIEQPPQAAQPIEVAPAVAPPAPLRERASILVVDDEPLMGRAIARALGPRHTVVTLTSAREALALLGRQRFDLILCDLMMPDMTGMDLYRELSSLDLGLARGMVFLTGGAFTSGASEFLQQVPTAASRSPFDGKAIAALVAEVLAQAPARAG